ncbi:MAG: AbrB/MazE/SpoVT family DNA-binding domain-containing protein [Iamia sp.]
MRVSIDGSGRLIIPKPLRTALGLVGGSEVEVVADGGGLRLDPVTSTPRSFVVESGLPLLDEVDGPTFTDDDVRSLRDELNR